MKTTIKPYRLFVTAGVVSLILIYIILWVKTINDPKLITGSDFIAFYTAGRISLSGNLSNVFNPAVQQAGEENILGFSIMPNDLNPFVHPPFILPLLALLASFSYVLAFHIWALILICLYIISALFLYRIVPQLENRSLILLGTVLFFPAFVSILNGQDSALLLFGCSIWLYGLMQEDDRLAGIGLALATIRPHIALILALPFLFRRQKVWWWFLGCTVALVVFCIILIGVDGIKSFLAILSLSAQGQGYKINEQAMVNLIGLIRRIDPASTSGQVFLPGWIFYGLGITALCLIWAGSNEIKEMQVGLAVIISLLTAPHLHYHDLVLLLIPIFCIMRLFSRSRIISNANLALLPLITSWLLLISDIHNFLWYNMPYLLYMVLGYILLFPGQSTRLLGSRKGDANV